MMLTTFFTVSIAINSLLSMFNAPQGLAPAKAEMSNVALAKSKKSSFFDYKHTGKVITNLTKMLVVDSTNFEYGIQSYRKYPIVGTTAFYNQPTDYLHYILITPDKRTFHFEIPVLGLTAAGVDGLNPQSLELRSAVENPILIKEYNAKGGLVFSLNYTVVKLPIPNKVKGESMQKLWLKIMLRAQGYNKKVVRKF